jgi:putative restriction endonuclease
MLGSAVEPVMMATFPENRGGPPLMPASFSLSVNRSEFPIFVILSVIHTEAEILGWQFTGIGESLLKPGQGGYAWRTVVAQMDTETDQLIRRAAFTHVGDLIEMFGQVVPYRVLAQGFPFRGSTVHLVAQQGIFIPAGMQVPLSIRTTPPAADGTRPYEDELGPDNLLRYRYRGEDPHHRENAGLRKAWSESIPLIWLSGVSKGMYEPFWPVFIHDDDPASLTFTVAFEVDDVLGPDLKPLVVDEARRAYITQQVRRRVHQTRFRSSVLAAYKTTCAICRLKEGDLLDAAHIIPDNDPHGDPVVPNGLALCKIHHAAFDRNILGVRPDLVVEVRSDILTKSDGPMLLHGLQEAHGEHLVIPRRPQDRPGAQYIEERYERFRYAS